jgi:DNA topoisomerase IB
MVQKFKIKSLTRLRNLVIPPIWSAVYICGFDDEYIQAISRDLKAVNNAFIMLSMKKIGKRQSLEKC